MVTAEHISSVYGVNNLRALWDLVRHPYTGYPDDPLDYSYWDRQATEATSLPSEYPISSSKINAGQFSEQAGARRLPYQLDTCLPILRRWREDPDQDYTDAGGPVISKQAMLGVNRLDALMVAICDSKAHAYSFIIRVTQWAIINWIRLL